MNKGLKRPIKIFLALLIFAVILLFKLTVYYPVDMKLGNWNEPQLPEDLDAYLKDSEAKVHPKAGTEKAIIWADADKRQTPIALVYIHGFSASRREISPVVEDLGTRFHANVFFTRLEGHGLGVSEFDQAKASDWIRDANEALAIGKRLGKKVVLIGTSTGVPLALHLADHKDPAIAGLVLISANFRPARVESLLGSGILGSSIARLVIGKDGYTRKVTSPERQYYWTTTFTPESVHQLMELLKYANDVEVANLKIPSLWLYTENDHVISLSMLLEKFSEMGGPKRIINTHAPSHVIAGKIANPDETPKVEGLMQDFIQRLSFENGLPTH